MYFKINNDHDNQVNQENQGRESGESRSVNQENQGRESGESRSIKEIKVHGQ